jgi:hypothetical protein
MKALTITALFGALVALPLILSRRKPEFILIKTGEDPKPA